MRRLIRTFDGFLRRRYGVFEFTDDPKGLIRLQVTRASRGFRLSDGVEVRPGDRLLILHLWNEHLPPIGEAGADVAWAVRMIRGFIPSLRAAAGWLAAQPQLSDVRAFGGATALVVPGEQSATARLFERLGFDLFPYRSPLGRFSEFWENLYTWWLMWAFNAGTLHSHHLLTLRRGEIWMSTHKFLEMYGPQCHGQRTASGSEPQS
jgi:hypothetical protein